MTTSVRCVTMLIDMKNLPFKLTKFDGAIEETIYLHDYIPSFEDLFSDIEKLKNKAIEIGTPEAYRIAREGLNGLKI